MSKKGIGVFKIYFEDNGDMMLATPYQYNYPGAPTITAKTEDNHIFYDRLEYQDYTGLHIIMKSLSSGRKYYFFMRDFHNMIKAFPLINNVAEGDFTFTKKGIVQGLKMVLPVPPKP